MGEAENRLSIAFLVTTDVDPVRCVVGSGGEKSATSSTTKVVHVDGEERSHDRTPSSGRRHKCSVCGEDFARKAHLLHHGLRHKRRPELFKCRSCKMAFVHKLHFMSHVKREHVKPGGVMCHQCGQRFPSQNELTAHVAREHVRATHWHPCPECGRKFENVESVKRHLSMVHRRLKYAAAGGLNFGLCSPKELADPRPV